VNPTVPYEPAEKSPSVFDAVQCAVVTKPSAEVTEEMIAKWIEDALYVNETDAYLAARAVDLYKADLEKQRKVKDAPKREIETRDAAAQSMRSNSAPDLGSGAKKWLESEVDKMSSREYAKYAKEIDEAISSGNFIYDISGAAR